MTTLVKKYVGFGGFRASSLISALVKADQAYRNKRHLARLDTEHLADVGLTREQAYGEYRKPVWKR